jgi:flagellin-like protein
VIDTTFLKGKKAVSPVIAVVLMIAVAVAITVVVYAWSTGFVSKRGTHESSQAEHVIIENMSLSGTTLTIYVRNMVFLDVVLDAVYVNGQMRASSIDTTVNADTLTMLNLSTIVSGAGGDGTFVVGDRVQVTSKRGTIIKFDVKS